MILTDAQVFLVMISTGLVLGAIGVSLAITGRRQREQRRAARTLPR